MINNKIKTDEQMVEIINQYMAEHPNVGRNHIILHATGNPTRVRELDKRGLIKLPKPLPSGSKSNWAKYFQYASESNAKRKGMKYDV